jgi:S-adenosylmethionine/arginine decarboxylase-like enzyme
LVLVLKTNLLFCKYRLLKSFRVFCFVEKYDKDHKHLLINATFEKTPFVDEFFTRSWISNLVNIIGMEELLTPQSARSEEKGNEGVSAFCIITTSHICLHSWEKMKPNLVQLDVYSCKDFCQFLILDELKKFKPIRLGGKYLDRSIENTRGWEMGREDLF